MRWRNSEHQYGLAAIVLHWATALAVIGLFVLGLWMVELTYYDPWYRRAPAIHKAAGILLFVVVTLRLAWRIAGPVPEPDPAHRPWERRLAAVVHAMLYLLLFAVMIAGYLITTADGRPVDVFGLFSVPATVSGLENQEDIAGTVHLVLAIALVSLAGLHALGALKHHFIDRDRTLKRLLGTERTSNEIPETPNTHTRRD